MIEDRGIQNLIIIDNLGCSSKWKNFVGKSFGDIITIEQCFPWLEGRESEIEAFIHLGACSSTVEKDAGFLLENNYRFSGCVDRLRGRKEILASSQYSRPDPEKSTRPLGNGLITITIFLDKSRRALTKPWSEGKVFYCFRFFIEKNRLGEGMKKSGGVQMKTFYFLMSSLLLFGSVEGNEENMGAVATEENAYQGNREQSRCYRRCYRRYSYHPIRTFGHYYYYDNRYIPTWPTRNNFYFFDILRR